MKNSSFLILSSLIALSFIFLIGCGSSGDRELFTNTEEGERIDDGSSPSGSSPGEQTSTGPRSNNPPCESLAFGDGRGGDLWIPQSESNGLPVYILNNEWQDPATVDAVLTSGGQERANFTGFANPDAGIERPHFRFSRGCRSYTGTLIVTDASQVCEVQLPGDVCSRID